jgi:hypothetical protein
VWSCQSVLVQGEDCHAASAPASRKRVPRLNVPVTDGSITQHTQHNHDDKENIFLPIIALFTLIPVRHIHSFNKQAPRPCIQSNPAQPVGLNLPPPPTRRFVDKVQLDFEMQEPLTGRRGRLHPNHWLTRNHCMKSGWGCDHVSGAP